MSLVEAIKTFTADQIGATRYRRRIQQEPNLNIRRRAGAATEAFADHFCPLSLGPGLKLAEQAIKAIRQEDILGAVLATAAISACNVLDLASLVEAILLTPATFGGSWIVREGYTAAVHAASRIVHNAKLERYRRIINGNH